MVEQAMSTRTLVLIGGSEWMPGCEALDLWWGSRAARKAVTVVTTAAQDGPERAMRRAEGYFSSIGFAADHCRIQTAKDAEDPRLLGVLSQATAIFLCGGDPSAARRVLVGSPAGRLLLDRYREGVPLVGSSAGAMVLAGACLVPSQHFAVQPGLGIVPRVLVVPHWNSAGAEWRRRVHELVDQYEVLAVDELTGVCWDGTSWSVLGAGSACVATSTAELVAGGGIPSPPIE